MQLFISVVSDTAKSIDGHYINIGVSLASFASILFPFLSCHFLPVPFLTLKCPLMVIFLQPLTTAIMALLSCCCHCIMLLCYISFLHEFLFVVFRFWPADLDFSHWTFNLCHLSFDFSITIYWCIQVYWCVDDVHLIRIAMSVTYIVFH